MAKAVTNRQQDRKAYPAQMMLKQTKIFGPNAVHDINVDKSTRFTGIYTMEQCEIISCTCKQQNYMQKCVPSNSYNKVELDQMADQHREMEKPYISASQIEIKFPCSLTSL